MEGNVNIFFSGSVLLTAGKYFNAQIHNLLNIYLSIKFICTPISQGVILCGIQQLSEAINIL